jgi:hypothetical protein
MLSLSMEVLRRSEGATSDVLLAIDNISAVLLMLNLLSFLRLPEDA